MSCPQASDLDGEIDLSTCYNVTEYQAQRNYGFQIHVSVLSLSSPQLVPSEQLKLAIAD